MYSTSCSISLEDSPLVYNIPQVLLDTPLKRKHRGRFEIINMHANMWISSEAHSLWLAVLVWYTFRSKFKCFGSDWPVPISLFPVAAGISDCSPWGQWSSQQLSLLRCSNINTICNIIYYYMQYCVYFVLIRYKNLVPPTLVCHQQLLLNCTRHSYNMSDSLLSMSALSAQSFCVPSPASLSLTVYTRAHCADRLTNFWKVCVSTWVCARMRPSSRLPEIYEQ